MKIAIDVSQVAYETGVGNYTKNLVKYLLKIDHKNTYVLFSYSLRLNHVLNKFKEELKNYKNIKFKLIPVPITLAEIFSNRIRIYPIDSVIENADIYHSSDWTQPKIKNPLTKKITTVHDMIPFLFESATHPKIVSTQKKRLKLVKKETDLIFADSETTKEDLVKFLEIPKEKIKVVYLGVGGEFNPQSDETVQAVLDKYKISKPYILSLATQEPRKNIQRLLNTFEKVSQKYPNLKLVLIGKHGWGESLKIPQKVITTGFVQQEDLPMLYSGARLFVYPSLYEGFGLPVLEAMACGVPVVTSNNSSLTEIAKDAAILIDPRSEGQLQKAIEMIMGLTLENYQKMVRASIDRARKYSWTKTAKEVLAQYTEITKDIN